MKLRKILATVAASAIAVSAMAVTSSADDITEGTIDLFQVCTYYQDSVAWTWNASDPVTFDADGKAKVEWDLSTLTSADDSTPGKIGYQMVYKGNDNDFEISYKCTSAQLVGDATVDIAGLVGEQTKTVAGEWKTTNNEILLAEAPIAATTADVKKLGKLVVEVELTKTPYETTFGAAAAEDDAAPALDAAAMNITSIESIEVTFEIKDLDAPVDMNLTVVTAADAAAADAWTTNEVISDPVNVPEDGTYTVKAEGLSGTVIHNMYVKDVLADAATAGKGATIQITNVKINGFDFGAPLAGAAAKEPEAATKCLDIAVIHPWMELAKGDVVLSAGGLVNLVYGGGNSGSFEVAAPVTGDDEVEEDDVAADDDDEVVADDDDEATEEVVDAGDVVAPTTDDKGNADTGVEGVAVVAGLAVLAAAGVVVAKKRK